MIKLCRESKVATSRKQSFLLTMLYFQVVVEKLRKHEAKNPKSDARNTQPPKQSSIGKVTQTEPQVDNSIKQGRQDSSPRSTKCGGDNNDVSLQVGVEEKVAELERTSAATNAIGKATESEIHVNYSTKQETEERHSTRVSEENFSESKLDAPKHTEKSAQASIEEKVAELQRTSATTKATDNEFITTKIEYDAPKVLSANEVTPKLVTDETKGHCSPQESKPESKSISNTTQPEADVQVETTVPGLQSDNIDKEMEPDIDAKTQVGLGADPKLVTDETLEHGLTQDTEVEFKIPAIIPKPEVNMKVSTADKTVSPKLQSNNVGKEIEPDIESRTTWHEINAQSEDSDNHKLQPELDADAKVEDDEEVARAPRMPPMLCRVVSQTGFGITDALHIRKVRHTVHADHKICSLCTTYQMQHGPKQPHLDLSPVYHQRRSKMTRRLFKYQCCVVWYRKHRVRDHECASHSKDALFFTPPMARSVLHTPPPEPHQLHLNLMLKQLPAGTIEANW